MQGIDRKIDSICAPLGRRVNAVVNYETFVLDRDIEDVWAQSVGDTVAHWHAGVTRYTTSAFLRAKLGEALSRRKLAAHVFETETEALSHMERAHLSARVESSTEEKVLSIRKI